MARGCKPINFDGSDDFDGGENQRAYFQSCTTDLCNTGLTRPVELTIDGEESENTSGKSTDLGQLCIENENITT